MNRVFEQTGISKCQILNRSNISIFFGDGSSNFVKNDEVFVWDDDMFQCVHKFSVGEPVLNIGIQLTFIYIVTQSKIFAYETQNGKLIHDIETYLNPKGLLSLCGNSSLSIIAIPGKKSGNVRVIDCAALNKLDQEFTAFDHEIQQIKLNYDGTKVATASEEGTLVRVFDTTTIYSISFDLNSHYIGITSSSKTIHIFELPDFNQQSNIKKRKEGTDRSIMKVKIPSQEYSICGFDKKGYFYIVTKSGKFYQFQIDFQQQKMTKKSSYNLHSKSD
ncbi:wd-repeat protein interacting with phosphoinosides wipi -related [Anaeramoeba ignava]|uniref:Wd-repeat protein interacting with phosphoinosides wipi -related n=1 Tax=Anaeramoeba ignava TaxID=1746090 RepID=A0A9Q0L7D0_ANAIG|nr:wd-repeat protein interacting with phosphoinosides wipi -related [Anaeramoeba ignava]